MSLQSDFQKDVLEKLKPLGEELTTVLKHLIAYEYPAEVKAIHFEVFPDGFTTEFPVRTFFLDSDNTEFFIFDENDNAQYPCSINPDLIELESGVYDETLEDKYLDTEEDFDTYTYASEMLITWFADIWKKACNEPFKLNAFISVHDDTPIKLN